MLVEHGYVRAQTAGGEEFTFLPSFGRIASLGSPQEIVRLFADLHGPRALESARHVLACLCEQDDPLPLIGWSEPVDGDEEPPARTSLVAGVASNPGQFTPHRHIDMPGLMPVTEQILIARHLMVHGICGTARPGKSEGGYSEEFDASEYIAAARVHLGLSGDEASGLSMSEFQSLWAAKFPDAAGRGEVPEEDEYEATMAMVREKPRG